MDNILSHVRFSFYQGSCILICGVPLALWVVGSWLLLHIGDVGYETELLVPFWIRCLQLVGLRFCGCWLVAVPLRYYFALFDTIFQWAFGQNHHDLWALNIIWSWYDPSYVQPCLGNLKGTELHVGFPEGILHKSFCFY